MRKLVRTVPITNGDDIAVHDDIMHLDIDKAREKESYKYENYVRSGDYKKNYLNNNHFSRSQGKGRKDYTTKGK